MREGSYMAIRTGMAVAGPDGRVGTVAEVVADAAVDVFRGIVVTHGLLGRRSFVDQSRVVAVVGDEVQVDLRSGDVDSLPDAPRSSQPSGA